MFRFCGYSRFRLKMEQRVKIRYVATMQSSCQAGSIRKVSVVALDEHLNVSIDLLVEYHSRAGLSDEAHAELVLIFDFENFNLSFALTLSLWLLVSEAILILLVDHIDVDLPCFVRNFEVLALFLHFFNELIH